VRFDDREQVRHYYNIGLSDPLYFRRRGPEIFIRDYSFKDTDTNHNIELSIPKEVHRRSITTDESKVVLEDFLMRIKVQSYDLVFVVKILE